MKLKKYTIEYTGRCIVLTYNEERAARMAYDSVEMNGINTHYFDELIAIIEEEYKPCTSSST